MPCPNYQKGDRPSAREPDDDPAGFRCTAGVEFDGVYRCEGCAGAKPRMILMDCLMISTKLRAAAGTAAVSAATIDLLFNI